MNTERWHARWRGKWGTAILALIFLLFAAATVYVALRQPNPLPPNYDGSGPW